MGNAVSAQPIRYAAERAHVQLFPFPQYDPRPVDFRIFDKVAHERSGSSNVLGARSEQPVRRRQSGASGSEAAVGVLRILRGRLRKTAGLQGTDRDTLARVQCTSV